MRAAGPGGGVTRAGGFARVSMGVLVCALGSLIGPVHAVAAPPTPATFLVGTAAVDITPTTPVTMAAYGTFRVSAGVQKDRPFMARSIAISSADGSLAHTVVLTVLDSQGYFIAYAEDPLTDIGHFGTAGIRKQVSTDTGLDVEHMIVATTHTHNSPDSIGVWGGGSDSRNVAYLGVVREGAIRSIKQALANRRPATLAVGYIDARQYQDTLGQVRGDPATYPMDRILRVLQARDPAGKITATLVNYGVHGTVLGPEPVLSPDWTGEVAAQLDARWGAGTTLAVPGAVGRTWPTFPDPHLGSNWQAYLAVFGRLVVNRVDAALARSRPIVDGTVAGAGGPWIEPVTNPVALALLVDEPGIPGTIGGTMRSKAPPYLLGGGVITSDLNAFRVGDLFLGGAPAEAYPEVATELQSRIMGSAVCGDPRHVFTLSLTNDQVGYTPTTDEYLVAVQYGGDEGLFTVNPLVGNDVINQQLANARAMGLTTGPDYNGLTAGPLQPPPDQQNPEPPLVDASGPAPACPAAVSGTPAITAAGGTLPPTAAAAAGPAAPALLLAALVLAGRAANRRRRRRG
jgi:hypothetical protein